MKWALQDRGFLPNCDPSEKILDRDFITLEQVVKDLPDLVDSGKFQEFMYYHASGFFSERKGFSLTDFIECENHQQVERAFMLLSYVASAYIHSIDYRKKDKPTSLPKAVAVPLVRLAKAAGRPPILSYGSYCLHNWRRKDKSGPIELGNIELLQNFTREAKRDEDGFILVHVDIEAKASDALQAMVEIDYTVGADDFLACLERFRVSLVAMNSTMARMPEECSPEVYYNKVRPYIFGFNNIVYEGCFDNQPKSYRGETGAQSTIVPAILRFLGIKHKNSMLTKHLDDMMDYMPEDHVAFLYGIKSIRSRAEAFGIECVRAYNECVDQLIMFRKQHFDYAVNYIEKRVTDPTGTGGTPYVKWLGQLIEETKEFFLS